MLAPLRVNDHLLEPNDWALKLISEVPQVDFTNCQLFEVLVMQPICTKTSPEKPSNALLPKLASMVMVTPASVSWGNEGVDNNNWALAPNEVISKTRKSILFIGRA